MTTDPVTFAPIVEYDSEIIYWPHWKREDGTPIANSAGAPFPKPIVEPLSIGIVHIWKWEENFSGAIQKSRLNKVNSGSWNGWGQDEAWVSRITARLEEENGMMRWMVHYIIKCNPYKWTTNIPHIGYFYKQGNNLKAFQTEDEFQYVGFLDSNGDKTETPLESQFIIKGRANLSSFTGVS
jgi:hypothetical protein